MIKFDIPRVWSSQTKEYFCISSWQPVAVGAAKEITIHVHLLEAPVEEKKPKSVTVARAVAADDEPAAKRAKREPVAKKEPVDNVSVKEEV